MSLCCSKRCPLVLPLLFLNLALVLMCSSALQAQDETPPKADVFVGYQWLNPGGTVPVGGFPHFQVTPPSPVRTKLPSMPIGYGVTGTYNFTPHWGLSVDVGGNFHDLAAESTISVGPRFMWRSEGVNFFAHTLAGLNRISPKGVNASNGFGAVLGGGIDLRIVRALSLRLIEADYVVGRHNFSDIVGPQDPNLRRPVLEGVRLRTGLVFNLGGAAPAAPVAASCSVKPSEVMVGEPVTATVNATNFNPKHTPDIHLEQHGR